MDKMFTLGVMLSATDMLSPVMGKANKSVDNLGSKIKAVSGKLAIAGTASYAAGRAMLSPVMDTVHAYQDLAQAQGELESLDIGAEGIDAITRSAKEFADQFSGTTAPEFLSASYDIKSGISSLSDAAVGEFTRIAAVTGAATKSSTDEMTSLFATGYGIYSDQFASFGKTAVTGWRNLSEEEKDIKFGEYFSAGIATSVQKFKTKGSEMSAAISNLGATATSSGVQFSEQLSILGMLQATMSGSEAATKYRAFLNTAGRAGNTLGLAFTDANNQLLSTPEIIDALREKYGETIDAIESEDIKKAFGTDEAVSMIKLLYNETDTLKDNIVSMNSSLADGTKLPVEMALALNKGKEFKIFEQQANSLSSTIGTMFAPVISEAAIIVGDLVISTRTWIEENQTAATAIGFTVAGVGALLTVAGAILIPISAIGFALPALAVGFTAVGGAIGFMGTVLGTVGKAMLLNPIGLAVTAIAAGAYLIYRNWEPISNFFGRVWDGISIVFSSGVETVKNLFLNFSPLGQIIKNWEPISNFFGSMLDGLTTQFSSYFDWVFGKFDAVTGIFGTVKGWFSDDETQPANAAGDGRHSKFSPVPKKQMEGISGTKSIKTTATATAEAVSRTNHNSSSVKIDNVHINNPKTEIDVERAMSRAMERRRNRSYDDEEG